MLADSGLLGVAGEVPRRRPERTVKTTVGAPVSYVTSNPDGDDGRALTEYDLIGSATDGTGLFALDKVEHFSFLCLPPLAPGVDIGPMTLLAAARFCGRRQALLIVDPPAAWTSPGKALMGLRSLNFATANAALFFPRVTLPDLLTGTDACFPPCGVVTGTLARTDQQLELWDSQAEVQKLRRGIRPANTVRDSDARMLQQAGINVLRTGHAGVATLRAGRTLAPAEAAIAEFKSLAKRRLALHIGQSLAAGTRWVVFEPDREQCLEQLTAQVNAFMARLHQRGAFAGAPEEAWFVNCAVARGEAGHDLGGVELNVGFAPSKPGQFVVLRFSHRIGGSRIRAFSTARSTRGDNSRKTRGVAE